MHLINWDTLTLPKKNGGLGIERAKIKNETILTGLAWTCHQHPGKLWSSILRNKYTNQDRTIKKAISNTWKSLQLGWEYYIKASQWVVHNGEKVNFWMEKWFHTSPSLRSLIQGPLTQDHLTTKLNSTWQNNSWDLDTLPIQIPNHIKETI